MEKFIFRDENHILKQFLMIFKKHFITRVEKMNIE